jgi:hypothetical protein
MKTLIALTTTAILLSGCSSSVIEPKDDPIVQDLTGKPVAYVEKKLGLPNKRSETKSGAMVWVYLDKQKGMSANECTVTLSIRNDIIESVAIATDDQSLMSMVTSSCKRIRKTLTGKS